MENKENKVREYVPESSLEGMDAIAQTYVMELVSKLADQYGSETIGANREFVYSSIIRAVNNIFDKPQNE